nr:uncharacterized protein LOC107281211 [Oryza sativa Japonica Group]
MKASIDVKPRSTSTLFRSILFFPRRENPLLTPSCFVHCSDGNATSSTGALERAPSIPAADIVVVPTAVDQAKPSRRTNVFSSRIPGNGAASAEIGHRLLHLRSPSPLPNPPPPDVTPPSASSASLPPPYRDTAFRRLAFSRN